MDSKKYTVILVPHARAKFRKFQVTSAQLRVASAALLALGATSSYVTWSFLTASVDEAQVEVLATENATLREVNLAFERDIQELRSQLETYEERTRRLAIVAGIDPLSQGEAGLGGDLVAGPPQAADTLRERLDSMAEELGRVESSLADRADWIASTPAVTPVRGLVTSTYGNRHDPITGRPAFHQGLDISARAGQEVVATAAGIVVEAGRQGHLGNAVTISHGYGLTTRYGHMAKLVVQPGQDVERGDVIGYVGNSGRSTGYHLHYEVLREGRQVDPIGYLLDRQPRGP